MTRTVTNHRNSNSCRTTFYDPHTGNIVLRDVLFLMVCCVAASIIAFVETNASEPEARKLAFYVPVDEKRVNSDGIVDTGFLLTYPLYEWLRDHRDWNDFFAATNSIVLVVPFLYVAYVTLWKGDYSVSFRIVALQLLRALCGWLTYLPPDPTYLNSYYDFPDVVHCLFQECQGQVPQAMPFVSFFSGHCATMVVVGNYLWLHGHFQSSILTHALNVLQIVRLLATRGHYSIDIIMGWFVAVYVTNPAGRLGRYFSQGISGKDVFSTTPQEAFETITGVQEVRNEQLLSLLLKHPDVQEALISIKSEGTSISTCQSETTLRIVQEIMYQRMQEQILLLQDQIQWLQEGVARHATALSTMLMDPLILLQGGDVYDVVEKKGQ